MEKSKLLEDLFAGEVKFTFTKVDGTLRDMRATLSPEFLPPKVESEEEPRVYPDNQIRAYDLDVKGWRSFRIENLVAWDGDLVGI